MSPSNIMPERVELKTSDNVILVGDYYAPDAPSARGLLLLHMMPSNRGSWKVFAEKMRLSGWRVLAIDLRGHGESERGPDGYKNFSDAEHQASRLDVEAGADFLASRGATSLSLGGASIGANLAINYLAEHSEAVSAFLLSPGLDYRGVTTEEAARRLRPEQAVYLAASSEDMRSSGSSATAMARALYEACSCRKELKELEGAGHGTTMFEREPALMEAVVAWLSG